MSDDVDFGALMRNMSITPGLDPQTPGSGQAVEGQNRNADLIRKAYECPRCKHLIPNDKMPGAYPGALSRWDNATEVCSACGTDEAMGNGPVPKSEWPVTVAESLYRMNQPPTVDIS